MYDRLAALRSLLEWIMFVIILTLAATVVFNLFCRIDYIEGVDIRGNSGVYVVVQKNWFSVENGDIVIADVNGKKRCAEIIGSNETGTEISFNGRNIFTVKENSINGVALFILYPFECTGEDVYVTVGGIRK